jgi:hypothetical protein
VLTLHARNNDGRLVVVTNHRRRHTFVVAIRSSLDKAVSYSSDIRGDFAMSRVLEALQVRFTNGEDFTAVKASSARRRAPARDR